MKIDSIISNLNRVTNEIANRRRILLAARKAFSDEATALSAIPTNEAALIAAINALGNASHEQCLKSQLSAIAASFSALQSAAASAATWLNANTSGINDD